MKTASKYPVIFNGRKYCGIREFDCIHVGLFTEPTLQGTFFTSIPISSLKFRKSHESGCKVVISTNKHWTTFNITDDLRSTSIMQIRNSLSKEIEYARQAAINYGLLVPEEAITTGFQVIDQRLFVQYSSHSHMFKVDQFQAMLLNSQYNVNIFSCTVNSGDNKFTAYLAELGYGLKENIIGGKLHQAILGVFQELDSNYGTGN